MSRVTIKSLQEKIKELEASNEKLKNLDAAAATHVESQIVMLPRFTGEPPYVGWKGIGLALKEELSEKRTTELLLKQTLQYYEALQTRWMGIGILAIVMQIISILCLLQLKFNIFG